MFWNVVTYENNPTCMRVQLRTFLYFQPEIGLRQQIEVCKWCDAEIRAIISRTSGESPKILIR